MLSTGFQNVQKESKNLESIDYTSEMRTPTDRKTFPDFRVTIEGINPDTVCVYIELAGTHASEYCGLTPTGKKVKVRGVQIYRIVDGEVVEGWADHNS